MPLKGTSISGTSAKVQDRRNGYQEVGVSHGSDVTSNDRGAKGWQTDRTSERYNDRTQQRRTIMVNKTLAYIRAYNRENTKIFLPAIFSDSGGGRIL